MESTSIFSESDVFGPAGLGGRVDRSLLIRELEMPIFGKVTA